MKINDNGIQEEAYNLVMRKENALDIISGKKKIEIRAFNDYYCSRFIDKKIAAKNEKLIAQGREDECEESLRGDVNFAHFHDYNNNWYLDVELNEIAIETLDRETVEALQEEFDFHDFDNEVAKYDHLPDEEKPMFFLLGIGRIVSHNINI